MPVNAQYNVAAPESLPVKIAGRMRRQMYERFLERLAPREVDTILDVGVTSDRTYDHSNYVEAWYPYKHRITAAGIDDASFLEGLYPGLRFVRADGRDLPFEADSFDYVHSSAVLEHVGSRARQRQFLSELWRVARKGIFVTTPNVWFPVEFHTVLPLVHWLPPKQFRFLLRRLGKEFFAEEANLNLLAASDVSAITRSLGISGVVETVGIAGWPTNLLLVARKDGDRGGPL